MELINQIIQGVLLGGYYAILASGLSFLFGVMRIVNLAHGSLVILAAYLILILSNHFGVNVGLGLLMALPLMAMFGWMLNRLLLQRSLRGGMLVPILATFGLSIVIDNVLFQIFAAALVVLGGLQLALSYTGLGRAIRATAEDPDAVNLIGIDSRTVYSAATAISMLLITVAGAFLAVRSTFAPYTGQTQLLFAFETVVIGGTGSLWGTLLGGIVLGVAQSLGAQIDPIGFLIAGHVVFLLVLVLRVYSGQWKRPRPAWRRNVDAKGASA
jgi:branched-chain amino acid transport system permease protein